MVLWQDDMCICVTCRSKCMNVHECVPWKSVVLKLWILPTTILGILFVSVRP